MLPPHGAWVIEANEDRHAYSLVTVALAEYQQKRQQLPMKHNISE